MLDVEDLKTKSVFEIKSFAKKNSIDLKDARTKIEMLRLLEGKEVVQIAKQETPNRLRFMQTTINTAVIKKWDLSKLVII